VEFLKPLSLKEFRLLLSKDWNPHSNHEKRTRTRGSKPALETFTGLWKLYEVEQEEANNDAPPNDDNDDNDKGMSNDGQEDNDPPPEPESDEDDDPLEGTSTMYSQISCAPNLNDAQPLCPPNTLAIGTTLLCPNQNGSSPDQNRSKPDGNNLTKDCQTQPGLPPPPKIADPDTARLAGCAKVQEPESGTAQVRASTPPPPPSPVPGTKPNVNPSQGLLQAHMTACTENLKGESIDLTEPLLADTFHEASYNSNSILKKRKKVGFKLFMTKFFHSEKE
jgi:hypothetical protein